MICLHAKECQRLPWLKAKKREWKRFPVLLRENQPCSPRNTNWFIYVGEATFFTLFPYSSPRKQIPGYEKANKREQGWSRIFNRSLAHLSHFTGRPESVTIPVTCWEKLTLGPSSSISVLRRHICRSSHGFYWVIYFYCHLPTRLGSFQQDCLILIPVSWFLPQTPQGTQIHQEFDIYVLCFHNEYVIWCRLKI